MLGFWYTPSTQDSSVLQKQKLIFQPLVYGTNVSTLTLESFLLLLFFFVFQLPFSHQNNPRSNASGSLCKSRISTVHPQ